jgi:hypothetical protein
MTEITELVTVEIVDELYIIINSLQAWAKNKTVVCRSVWDRFCLILDHALMCLSIHT